MIGGRRGISEEELQARSRTRRLRQDLGVNPAGVEVILNLRRQVLTLQARVRELETEVAQSSARRSTRLAQYRETHLEATWLEIEKGE